MQIQTLSPFTRKQYDLLTEEQRTVLDPVAEYLKGETLTRLVNPTDEELSEIFNLLKVSCGCVPEEEIGDQVSSAIRKKFSAVYQTALTLAEAELRERKLKPLKDYNFCLVVEPEDVTHIVIIDSTRPLCYLHEERKAWHFHFETLSALAEEVLRVKKHLVEQFLQHSSQKEIFIVLEGGIVREVVNLPEPFRVTVLDYDVEDTEPEQLQLSPLDGELCHIKKF